MIQCVSMGPGRARPRERGPMKRPVPGRVDGGRPVTWPLPHPNPPFLGRANLDPASRPLAVSKESRVKQTWPFPLWLTLHHQTSLLTLNVSATLQSRTRVIRQVSSSHSHPTNVGIYRPYGHPGSYSTTRSHFSICTMSHVNARLTFQRKRAIGKTLNPPRNRTQWMFAGASVACRFRWRCSTKRDSATALRHRNKRPSVIETTNSRSWSTSRDADAHLRHKRQR